MWQVPGTYRGNQKSHRTRLCRSRPAGVQPKKKDAIPTDVMCGRWDSNPQGLPASGLKVRRVYQFRHARSPIGIAARSVGTSSEDIGKGGR